jgi:hypothetical protein
MRLWAYSWWHRASGFSRLKPTQRISSGWRIILIGATSGAAVDMAVWSTTGDVIFERSSQPGESCRGRLDAARDPAGGDHFSVDTGLIDD